jgi:hypothetical protein
LLRHFGLPKVTEDDEQVVFVPYLTGHVRARALPDSAVSSMGWEGQANDAAKSEREDP